MINALGQSNVPTAFRCYLQDQSAAPRIANMFARGRNGVLQSTYATISRAASPVLPVFVIAIGLILATGISAQYLQRYRRRLQFVEI